MAIAAATVSVKTMADNTLRITCDIEPNDAQEAFALFGMRGTAVALARLTDDAAMRHAQTQTQELKGGQLARLAGMLCSNPEFQEWLGNYGCLVPPEQCKGWIYQTCGITSRRELDHNAEAAQIFEDEIRKPFVEWRNTRA